MWLLTANVRVRSSYLPGQAKEAPLHLFYDMHTLLVGVEFVVPKRIIT